MSGKEEEVMSSEKKTKSFQKSKSTSEKAGLQFPVGRVFHFLCNGNKKQSIAAGAPVYMAAALEYITAEVLELSANAASHLKNNRIVPRHIMLGYFYHAVKAAVRKLQISFKYCIRKVLELVHPGIGISAYAKIVINDIIVNLAFEIRSEALNIAKSKTNRISAKEIKEAIKNILPAELARHAMSDGDKAILKWKAEQAKSKNSA